MSLYPREPRLSAPRLASQKRTAPDRSLPPQQASPLDLRIPIYHHPSLRLALPERVLPKYSRPQLPTFLADQYNQTCP